MTNVTSDTAASPLPAFNELGLSGKMLNAISAAGYETPTAIQAQTIPHALQRRDVLGLSQTGSGKTASFLIPILEQLASFKRRARMPSVLILEPTRELAAQVVDSINLLGKPFGVTSCLIIGGTSDQSRALMHSIDIVVATPGRLLDLKQRGGILLTGVQVFVLDEADRMLDMGFIPDVERIEASLPENHQTMFYSATMSSEIERLVHQFMRDPAIVRIAPKVMTAASITQKFYAVEPTQKTSLLATLLAEHAFESAIIFCNRKRDIPLVCRGLGRAGYRAEALHGDMSQEQRSRTLRAFKAGQIDLLVASDVAARGLDVDDLPVVVNYDVPKSSEDYIHRIGRTGRAGKTGMSITMVTGSDEKQIRALRKHLQKDIVVERINGMTLVEIDAGADRGGGSSSRSYSASRNGGRSGDDANRSYRSQEGGAGRSGGFDAGDRRDRGSRSSYGSRRRSGEDAGSSYPAASAAPGGNSPHGDRNPNGASTPGTSSRRRPSAGFSARGDVSNDNSSRGRGERGEFKARSGSSAGSRRHADDSQSHDFPGFLKKRPSQRA